MSTGTATPTTVVVQYDRPAEAGYVAPPPGMSYMRKEGKVILGQDGQPVTRKKKASKGRSKSKKPIYAVPAGKLPSAVTEGFDCDQHSKLKVTDFADPLHHAEWEVWFYEQKVLAARKDVERMKSLGSTPEERKEASEEMRLLKALENLAKKRGATGGSAKGRLAERLGAIFADISAG